MNAFFDIMEIIFPFIFGGMFLVFICAFGFAIATAISPKLRGKMMARQMEALKHASNYAKEDMKDVIENMGEVNVESQNRILDEYGDMMRDNMNRAAGISEEAIRKTASAVREGFAGAERTGSTYCRYCGAQIEGDSVFCRHCGKKQ